jgi:hypothetical protein
VAAALRDPCESPVISAALIEKIAIELDLA